MYTFYFTVSKGWIRPGMLAVPVLIPAASFARGRKGLPDVDLPPQVTEVAVDPGAFSATRDGGYSFTPEHYVEWLASRVHPTPRWAACFDLCCTKEVVREHQQWTTEMGYHFWGHFRGVPWAWVPTIQGFQTSEYVWHACQMRPLIEEMQAYYGPSSAFRVGIGSLLAEPASSAQMIQEVVAAIAAELPGIPFHLWGVKYRVLKHNIPLHPQVISSDSAVWHGRFGRDLERWRQSGKKEREWAWEDAAPQYYRKIKAALKQPKQLSLIEFGKEESGSKRQ